MSEIKHFDLKKITEALQTVQEYFNSTGNVWTPKKYYLDRVPNKKMGYVWYVRYLDNGVIIPSHWTTRTNVREKAEKYAVENRDKLLIAYYNRKIVKKSYGEMYSIFKKYYAKDSEYLQVDINRGKSLSERARNSYHLFITTQFIPYLKKNGISSFEQINTPFLARYQNYLLAGTEKKKGVKPQTIKIYIWTISQIFNHLIIEGYLNSNPCKSLVKLKISSEQIRGCYEITMLKGVFNKTWKNQLYYLLCLIIYTTGMRNSEIERMRVMDLIVVDNVHFVDITKSKTKNGVRIVPIHDFVYRKIISYVKKTGKKNTDLVFKNEGTVKIMSKTYERANLELAEYTKFTPEKLLEENITFYSGRHFWKTLMDSEKLGDIEEYFMGHKVNKNVAKRYNHKDKQGRKKLVERAKKVFQILDKYIFISR